MSAIVSTNLAQVASGSDLASYTASVTPTAGLLQVAWVSSECGSGTPNIPTLSGCGLTWVQVNTTSNSTSRLTMFRAMDGGATSGTLTVDFAGQVQVGCEIIVDEVANTDTTGTAGSGAIVQSNVNAVTTNGTSIQVNLGVFDDVNNGVIAASAHSANEDATPKSGYTLVGTGHHTLPSNGTSSEFITTNDRTPNMAWATGAKSFLIAAEIRCITQSRHSGPGLHITGASAMAKTAHTNRIDSSPSIALSSTPQVYEATGVDAATLSLLGITPKADALVLLFVAHQQLSGSGAVVSPSVTGCGMTWALHSSVQVSNLIRLSVFRAQSASPTTGDILIDFGGKVQTSMAVGLSQFEGVPATVDNGASSLGHVANAVLAAKGTSVTATLGSFTESKNNVVAAQIHFVRENFTPGSGFVALGGGSSSGPALSFGVERATSNQTTASVSWATAAKGAILAVEVKLGQGKVEVSGSGDIEATDHRNASGAASLDIISPTELGFNDVYRAAPTTPAGYDDVSVINAIEATSAFHESAIYGGGHVNVIAEDLTTSGRFLRGGDVMQISETLDSGLNWRPRAAGMTTREGIACLWQDPVNPLTWYAPYGTGTSGDISQSTDNGLTWRVLSTGLVFNGGNKQTGDSSPNMTVVRVRSVGRLMDRSGSRIFVGTFKAGVYKSDNGTTFSLLGTGLPARSFVAWLSVNPDDPTVLYAGLAEDTVTGVKGLWKCTGATGGSPTWTQITSPAGVKSISDGIFINGLWYFACEDGGVWTWDGGSTWVNIGSGHLSTSSFWSTIDGFMDGATIRVWVGCSTPQSDGASGFINVMLGESTDSGATWSWSTVTGTANLDPTILNTSVTWWDWTESRASVLGGNNHNSDMVYLDGEGNLWELGNAGIWKSSDQGTTWNPSLYGDGYTVNTYVAIDPADDNTAWVSDADFTLWSTTDAFVTVALDKPGGFSSNRVGPVAVNASGTVYACLNTATTPKVYKKSGGTWSAVTPGSLVSTSSAKAILVGKNGANDIVLFAMTSASPDGVWRSADGGSTWTHIITAGAGHLFGVAYTGQAGFLNGVTTDPNDSACMFLADPATGLWKSLDYGATWVKIWTKTNSSGTFHIAWSGSGVLFLISSTAVWQVGTALAPADTTDASKTVDNAQIPATQLSGIAGDAIACAPDGTLYVAIAATPGVPGSMFRSTDQGVSFTDISDDVYRAVTSVIWQIAATNSGRVYVATNGQGVVAAQAAVNPIQPYPITDPLYLQKNGILAQELLAGGSARMIRRYYDMKDHGSFPDDFDTWLVSTGRSLVASVHNTDSNGRSFAHAEISETTTHDSDIDGISDAIKVFVDENSAHPAFEVTPSGVYGGGALNNVVQDTDAAGTFFTGGDVSSISKTTSGGSDWFPSSAGFIGRRDISSIIFDPTNHDVMYALEGLTANTGRTSTGGFYRSADRGKTWSKRSAAVAGGGNGNFPGAGSRSVGNLIAKNAGIIYVGTFADGMWKSSDEGLNWTRHGSTAGMFIRGIVQDPADPSILYAGVIPSGALITSILVTGTGPYTCTVATADAHGLTAGQIAVISGSNPTAFNGAQTVLSAPTTTTFTFSLVSNPGTWVAAGDVHVSTLATPVWGIYKILADGTTTHLSTPSNVRTVDEFWTCPVHNRIYALCHEAGLIYSDDHGATWTAGGTLPPTSQWAAINGVHGTNDTLYIGGSGAEAFSVGVYKNIFKSTDSGANFVCKTDGVGGTVGYTVYGTSETWWLNTNGPNNMLGGAAFVTHQLVIDANDSNTVLLVGKSGGWITHDGGSTWQPMVHHMTPTAHRTGALSPLDSSMVDLWNDDWNFFSSDDALVTIHQDTPNGLGQIGNVDIDETGKHWIAISGNAGTPKKVLSNTSPVSNTTWTDESGSTITAAVPRCVMAGNDTFGRLLIVPVPPSGMYVLSNATWVLRGGPPYALAPTGSFIYPNPVQPGRTGAIIYAYDPMAGVYKSTDYGVTWFRLWNHDSGGQQVTHILTDTGGHLYVNAQNKLHRIDGADTTDISKTVDGGGLTATQLLPGEAGVVAIALTATGVLYAATLAVDGVGGKLFRSEDFGVTFTNITTDDYAAISPNIEWMAAADDGKLYFGANGMGAYHALVTATDSSVEMGKLYLSYSYEPGSPVAEAGDDAYHVDAAQTANAGATKIALRVRAGVGLFRSLDLTSPVTLTSKGGSKSVTLTGWAGLTGTGGGTGVSFTPSGSAPYDAADLPDPTWFYCSALASSIPVDTTFVIETQSDMNASFRDAFGTFRDRLDARWGVWSNRDKVDFIFIGASAGDPAVSPPDFQWQDQWPGDGVADLLGLDIYHEFGRGNESYQKTWTDLGEDLLREEVVDFMTDHEVDLILCETGGQEGVLVTNTSTLTGPQTSIVVALTSGQPLTDVTSGWDAVVLNTDGTENFRTTVTAASAAGSGQITLASIPTGKTLTAGQSVIALRPTDESMSVWYTLANQAVQGHNNAHNEKIRGWLTHFTSPDGAAGGLADVNTWIDHPGQGSKDKLSAYQAVWADPYYEDRILINPFSTVGAITAVGISNKDGDGAVAGVASITAEGTALWAVSGKPNIILGETMTNRNNVLNIRGPRGLQGDPGPAGPQGAAGAPGSGIPDGGLTGQSLIKQSNSDQDADWAAVTDAELSTSDVTTNNVSTSKHGFAPKAPNDATKFLDGTGSWDTVKDADLSTSDVTTNNVSTLKHGFAPKAPNDATNFLDGTGAWDTVKDSDLSTSDITTNNASTSKHGFLKKLDNDTTHFMRGDGAWAVPNLATSETFLTSPVTMTTAGTYYDGVSVTPAAGTYLAISTVVIDSPTNSAQVGTHRLVYGSTVMAEGESASAAGGGGVKRDVTTTLVALITADGATAIKQTATNAVNNCTISDQTQQGATADKATKLVLIRVA